MAKIKPKKHPAKKTAAKRSPRKKVRSTRRSKRLVRTMGEEQGKRTYDLSKASHSLLKKHLEVKTFAEVFEKARGKRIAQPLVRASRLKYLEAISIALALNYAVIADPRPEERLKQLSHETGYRPTARGSSAQVVVHAVINYGETKEEKALGRKFASRDAAAIEHLAEQGISPEEVVELGKKRGEGLEAWARAWSLSRRKKGPSASNDDTNDNLDVKDSDNEQDDEDQEIGTDDLENDDEDENDNDNEHHEDEAEQDCDKPAVLPLETIKQIAQSGGAAFRRSDEDDEITWAVVAIKLKRVQSLEKRQEALAKALEEYALQLRILTT